MDASRRSPCAASRREGGPPRGRSGIAILVLATAIAGAATTCLPITGVADSLSGVATAKAAPSPGAAETPPPSPQLLYAPRGRLLGAPFHRFAIGDTIEIVAWRTAPSTPWSVLPGLSLQPVIDANYHSGLLFRAMTRPHTYERSRFARVVLGADRMAGTAAALSGLGLVGGLWGEKTAGYLMGAGAVLGAIWGGTIGADNPGLRIGVEAEPHTLDFARRPRRIAGRWD